MKLLNSKIRAGLALLALGVVVNLAEPESNQEPRIKQEGNCAGGVLISQKPVVDDAQYFMNNELFNPPNTFFTIEERTEATNLTGFEVYPKKKIHTDPKTGAQSTSYDINMETIRETVNITPSTYLINGLPEEMTEGEWYRGVEFEGVEELFRERNVNGLLDGPQHYHLQREAVQISSPASICRDGGSFYSQRR